ncbi:MAG: 30S ribosomal protein S14 [Gammaproteobacteria bacterium]|nr:30S ribosomal protein S14 [Gammaproteobacteria bacterium]MDH5728669.1 30S ribosomal protein S14 [Gammaproteobacteria bacterium]
MAKKSIVNRELKRMRTVERFAEKRAALKKAMMNPALSDDEREEARRKFHALPRNASPCRLRNRCRLTGRPHGYYRKFGLSRNKLREHAMKGDIPGLVMSSW